MGLSLEIHHYAKASEKSVVVWFPFRLKIAKTPNLDIGIKKPTAAGTSY